MFYSIPFRILSIACSVPCPLPICPILLTMHVPVMALTHLICMFELYAPMHSPFYLIVESSYFPYAVHDICINGENIDIFSGMIIFISLVNHFRLCYCHSDGIRQ